MSYHLNITIDGVDYVAIPRKELGDNFLTEDAFDTAHYDRIKALLASGDEEMIPAKYVDRIMEGESPMRVWREFRGLTIQALADKVGASKGYLSEIENGLKDGSVRIMKRVAESLGVDLDDIV
ncbi:MAG: helix-turn-helix transcriptional regulator [Magnetococcales bacterium]|nr:helix-turn-helix transcriptional regulator [Magnetococcales bacterium]